MSAILLLVSEMGLHHSFMTQTHTDMYVYMYDKILQQHQTI